MGSRSTAGIVIGWPYGREEEVILVAGTFSKWQRWRMTWCSDRRDHRVFVPNKFLEPGTGLEFKFIVSGEWTCDGARPMREDAHGNINNFVSYPIQYTTELESDTLKIPNPTPSLCSPLRGIGAVHVESCPPMMMKLRKQLTSDTPKTDGIVGWPLPKFYPPPQRIYRKPNS